MPDPGPNTPYQLTDFGGADEDPLSEGGRWQGWWPADDALEKIAGTASAKVAGTGYASSATTEAYPADIEIVAEVATRPTHSTANAMVVGARIQNAGTATHSGYMGAAFTGSPNDNWRIYRVTSGSATLLVSGNAAQLKVGDSIGLVVRGTLIELWHYDAVSGSWNLRQTATDATYSAPGAIGIEAKGAVATPGAFDRVLVSELVGPDPGPQDITPDHLGPTGQIYVPQVSNAPAQELTPDHLGPTGEVYAPQLESDTSQSITPDHLGPTGQVYTPDVVNAPAQDLEPATLGPTGQVYAPQLESEAPAPTLQDITPSHLGPTGMVYAPQVIAVTPEISELGEYMWEELSPMRAELWPRHQVPQIGFSDGGSPYLYDPVDLGDELYASLAPMHEEEW